MIDDRPCLCGSTAFVRYETDVMVKLEGEEPRMERTTYIRCEDCLRDGRIVGSARRRIRIVAVNREKDHVSYRIIKVWGRVGYPDPWHGDVILGWYQDGEYVENDGGYTEHPSRREIAETTEEEIARREQEADGLDVADILAIDAESPRPMTDSEYREWQRQQEAIAAMLRDMIPPPGTTKPKRTRSGVARKKAKRRAKAPIRTDYHTGA